MALKPKSKSFELDIFSEAELAMERVKNHKPVAEVLQQTSDDNDEPRFSNPMSKWHAGVDVEKLPAMTDAENELFDKLRVKGSYVVVTKREGKYYLGLGRKPLDTKMINTLIKKGWLAKSYRAGKDAYFVTSHMIYGWRKRIGI